MDTNILKLRRRLADDKIHALVPELLNTLGMPEAAEQYLKSDALAGKEPEVKHLYQNEGLIVALEAIAAKLKADPVPADSVRTKKR